MKRNLTCIVCPKGCALTAEILDGKVSVTGQGCPRGVEYATNECLHPVRIVTLALPVANREGTMISVKTEHPIPKEHMLESVAMLHKLNIQAPVAMGEVLLKDLFGSRVVATMSVF